MPIFYAFASVIFVSLLSLLGAIFLVFKRNTVQKFITYTLAFSSGVLMGSAFLDILPESLAKFPDTTFPLVLVGFICFFTLEKILQWHHHVEGDHASEEKAVGYLSLIGDGIHNFGDGIIIGAAYLVSIPLGLTTTLAVVAHEIPHELSDFTILIYGGFSNTKALWYNFLSALTAIAGTAFIVIVSSRFGQLSDLLIPFAAGNFIYIAASDLIPELHKKRQRSISIIQIGLLIIGVLFVAFTKQYFS